MLKNVFETFETGPVSFLLILLIIIGILKASPALKCGIVKESPALKYGILWGSPALLPSPAWK